MLYFCQEKLSQLLITICPFQFVCDLTSMKAVREALESLGIHTLSAGLEFVPHTPSLLTQTQLETAFTLLEAVNDHPDVVRVWDNIHIQN